MAHDPVVFISSTSEDLKEHREQAAKAALASGFSPHMMEYFPASGQAPSLPACLEKVAEAEVVVVLVAHRYGWVPDAPENPGKKEHHVARMRARLAGNQKGGAGISGGPGLPLAGRVA